MAFKEITNVVERMEILEERAGIQVQGIMATVDIESNDGEYYVQLRGEVIATARTPLGWDVDVTINVYNAKAQVCGTAAIYLGNDDFIGIETIDSFISCKGYPAKIKIFIKKIPV